MENLLWKALAVRYVKLRFILCFSEDSCLPEDKVSALRGGIGEMLLRANCIKDRNCAACDFREECIVQRTMYSRFEIKPDFVTTGDSIGYVMECRDRREMIEAGGMLEFSLLLFGKTIVYFNQYVQAIYNLGRLEGIGKYHARFYIAAILNTRGQPILEGMDIRMERYAVETVAEYVRSRQNHMPDPGDRLELIFDTPLTLKFRGVFIREFDMEAIADAVRRRIYMLNCFEGTADPFYDSGLPSIPQILEQTHYPVSISRYSNRQNSKMQLRGIKGRVIIPRPETEFFLLLLAGELIHIGKNTSFGFGKYHIQM